MKTLFILTNMSLSEAYLTEKHLTPESKYPVILIPWIK